MVWVVAIAGRAGFATSCRCGCRCDYCMCGVSVVVTVCTTPGKLFPVFASNSLLLTVDMCVDGMGGADDYSDSHIMEWWWWS